MEKKIFKLIQYFLFIIFVFAIQIYVINNLQFFGTTGNIIIIAVAIVALNDNIKSSVIFSVITGLISDILFTSSIGKYIVIYVILGVLINSVGKIYNKESRGVIIYTTILATIIFEILMAVGNIAINKQLVNIFSFCILLLKEILLNVGLAYVMQGVINKIKK